MSKNEVRVRFAPSPTGFLHIGGARTALFNYLYAKKHSGHLILRIEDTDKERSTKEYEKSILEGLSWLGLDFDETHRQSERTEIYKNHLEKLISSGAAYISKEQKGERESVIRFRNPNTDISFTDLIRGEIKFNTTDLGDFVIAKSLEEPLYHLSVVVDDIEMGITHVIRGEDHISNTPRQLLIRRAITEERISFAHIPLILAKDRSKLSKRHGAVSLLEYQKMGYLPQALINYLALLGWNPKDDREIFTIDELVNQFDLDKIQKSGAIFDQDKLNWINKEHIGKLSESQLSLLVKVWLPDRIYAHPNFKKIQPILTERVHNFGELKAQVDAGEFDYFFDQPNVDKNLLNWKSAPATETKKHIVSICELLDDLDDKNFNFESIKSAIWDYAEKNGRGNVLWPMRVALSGKERSPDPFAIAEVIGKKETTIRLKAASNEL